MQCGVLAVVDGPSDLRAVWPASWWEGVRGLLGRPAPDLITIWCIPGHGVHTVGLAYPIDVAYCDAAGLVRWVGHLPPGRVGPWRRDTAWVAEGSIGWLARAGVRRGSVLQRPAIGPRI